jgi:cobalt-zinc-cadmium efflux system outer membrane protein
LLDFEKRLEKGDGNVMDVNKARLQLLDAKKRVTENETAISTLNTKLVELTGGIDVTFSETIYPIYQEVPQFEVIEAELEANDPSREILEQQEVIVQKKVELSKAVWFPKIEAGYRRTTGGGQAFNGVHTGISVPLWENRNTVKQQKASLQYAQANLGGHRTEHFYEIIQLYDRFVLLKESVEEYEKTLAAMNTKVLLNKALEVGHISTIEYFMGLNFYEQAFDRYLETEAEYYWSVAELLRYR